MRRPARSPLQLRDLSAYPRSCRYRCRCLLPLAGWLAVYSVHAQDAPTQSDWGGAGLLQTPSARMAAAGEVGFTGDRTAPYTRYNFTLQPMPWLEVTFRYVDLSNLAYGPASLSGTQTLKDKSIDAKVRLWRESHYLPELAIGARDIAGTGLFSSEYVVANKRFGPIDASLGMAWGYMGARGDITNPLSIVRDSFSTRPKSGSAQGGQLGVKSYFHGPAALFGGITYQTPWQPLILKLEYEGNNYRHEPHNDQQRQDTPINIGAVYRLNHSVDLSLALERGNTAMFGLTLHTNLAQHVLPAKLLDPPLPPRQPAPPSQLPEQVNWANVSGELQHSAGIRVSRIARRGRELVITGEQTRYFYTPMGLGRAARVLDNQLGSEIDWYTLVSTREGMPIVSTSVHRERFDALLDNAIELDDFRRSVEQDPPQPQREAVLYQAPPQKFNGGIAPAYSQSLGGPNAFILYQIALTYDADYHFTRSLWLSGTVSANLLNNYNKFTYDAPSKLPHVRTDVRRYLTNSRVTLPTFQLTTAHQLVPDLYGEAYAGMLESMFGGAGGEVLYRPFGARWAIGTDLNWVKQRGFDQGFTFRNYHVVTGHVTAYYKTADEGVLLAVSAGRYLAGDIGATVDVSHEFHNGVRIGAYATKTNVSSAQFGEGSFDKGIYVSIPFDLMLPRSTVSRANIVWDPLIRDGGAFLNRRYSLYTLTEDRDSDSFNDNLRMITQ